MSYFVPLTAAGEHAASLVSGAAASVLETKEARNNRRFEQYRVALQHHRSARSAPEREVVREMYRALLADCDDPDEVRSSPRHF